MSEKKLLNKLIKMRKFYAFVFVFCLFVTLIASYFVLTANFTGQLIAIFLLFGMYADTFSAFGIGIGIHYSIKKCRKFGVK